jgi:hypothetical protein
MRLIFIHGPAAVGKLTVARELAKLVSMPVFHNHLVVDAVGALFAFGTPEFIRLREEMWLAAFREAANAGQSLIFTFAPERTVRAEFIGETIATVERHGGRVVFVALTCSSAEIERRIESPSRAEFCKLKSGRLFRDLSAAGAFDFPPLPEVLTLDTGRFSPSETATQIRDYLAQDAANPG